MRIVVLYCVLTCAATASLRGDECCPDSPGGGYAFGQVPDALAPLDHVRVAIMPLVHKGGPRRQNLARE